MRQHIRETSLELRELEAKLKAAYTNKERHAQLAEKEALKYDKMVSHIFNSNVSFNVMLHVESISVSSVLASKLVGGRHRTNQMLTQDDITSIDYQSMH